MPSSNTPKASATSTAGRLAWQRVTPWVVGALALALYARTAAPGLTWAHHGADGGDFIAAAMTWGVPHPSGYPTYVLLARLFALLPLGELARRFNLFSATMAALAVAMTAVIIQRVATEDRQEAEPAWWPALVGGVGALALAASPALWSQALIAEVYTLHLAFLTALLVLATRPGTPGTAHWFMLGAIAGLGLGNHLTLGFVLPGITMLCWPHLGKRGRVAGAAGTLLGMGVYAYVPLAARGQPPVSWGDASTPSGFWWLVSGRLYHRYALAATWPQVWQRLLAALSLWREQFGLLGVALTFLGAWSWVERRRWRLLAGMGSIWLLTLTYAATYDTADSMLYLLPCYLVGTVWITSGTKWLARASTAETKLPAHWGYLVAAALLAAVSTSRVVHWHDTLDLSADHEAEIWLAEVLDRLPRDALLITLQDQHTFALWYALYAQDRRPDLVVVDADLYVEPWYRRQISRRADLQESVSGTLAELIETISERRSIYVTSNRIDLARRYQLTPEGPVWHLTQQSKEP